MSDTEIVTHTIDLGIHLVDLPPHHFQGWIGLTPTIQRRKERLPGATLGSHSILFRCKAKFTRDAVTGEPIFTGPYCFGNPDHRFLYLSWDGFYSGKKAMFRRLQVHLHSIRWADINAVKNTPGAWLMATTKATARDGGPAYSTAPIMGGRWTTQTDC